MSAERALVCGTSEAANLVGRADRIGSVSIGKLADLIVLDGNPLDDVAVLQGGAARHEGGPDRSRIGMTGQLGGWIGVSHGLESGHRREG